MKLGGLASWGAQFRIPLYCPPMASMGFIKASAGLGRIKELFPIVTILLSPFGEVKDFLGG